MASSGCWKPRDVSWSCYWMNGHAALQSQPIIVRGGGAYLLPTATMTANQQRAWWAKSRLVKSHNHRKIENTDTINLNILYRTNREQNGWESFHKGMKPRTIFLNNLLLTDPQSQSSSSQMAWQFGFIFWLYLFIITSCQNGFLYSALATSSGSGLKKK